MTERLTFLKHIKYIYAKVLMILDMVYMTFSLRFLPIFKTFEIKINN